MEEGYLKYLISQNIDGLHARSGIPADKLAEVHGNTNMEICKKCKRRFMRDFRTRTAQKVHDHKTGRKCESCGGDLYDSIINFGENLPERELEEGFLHSKRADLCLAMGSSLTVTPAADMPSTVGERGKRLVIINLQKTPLDDIAALRINGECDKVMRLVMEKLGIDVPAFALKRRVRLSKTTGDKPRLLVQGLDSTGKPYTLFKKVTMIQGKDTVSAVSNFKFMIPKGSFQLNLTFFGRYGEPAFTFPVDKFEGG